MIRFLNDWGDWLDTVNVNTSYGRIYNPQTHDIVPKREYIQQEIDRLSKTLKRYENNEKEAKKYWRGRQEDIKKEIAELTARLKD